MSTEFVPNIPDWLSVTPEEAAKLADEQRKRREKLLPVGRDQDEARKRYFENEAELAGQAMRSIFATSTGLQVAPEEWPRINFQRARLVDALRILGRYEEALDIAFDQETIDLIEQTRRAVEREDTEDCPAGDCVDHRKTFGKDNREIVTPRKFIRERVYSPKHGKMMSLVVCSQCGDMNVTPHVPVIPVHPDDAKVK